MQSLQPSPDSPLLKAEYAPLVQLNGPWASASVGRRDHRQLDMGGICKCPLHRIRTVEPGADEGLRSAGAAAPAQCHSPRRGARAPGAAGHPLAGLKAPGRRGRAGRGGGVWGRRE